MPNTAPDRHIHVAAAVLVNKWGEVLIGRRHRHQHQGGLWEFPGGKLEPGEDVFSGLQRELNEELGIEVQHGRPLIRVQHSYPDRDVLLDVWRVDAFRGTAYGREGQPIQWVAPSRLLEYRFPAANLPILQAARLPDRYLITPDPDPERGPDFLDQLERVLAGGIRLFQLRARDMSADEYAELARRVCELAARYNAQVILNADPALVEQVGAAGVQLNSKRLRALSHRPLPAHLWVGASCHNSTELDQAARIGADFALLSPVLPTPSHPDATPLGWSHFQHLTDQAGIPVYALGGVSLQDLEQAWAHGAQGIASVRGLWSV